MALIQSSFITCLSYRIKKHKKATTFKWIKLLKHTQKHAVTTEDRILIRHYRLDKSIEPENLPLNNPNLNPADYSILEYLSQKLYKHQRIRDMQHLKDLLEEKWEELPQYESDACINQLRYRLLKVIEVAGKHILNIFTRFAVERNVWLLFIIACSSHLLSLLNHKKMSFALDTVQ